MPIRVQNDLPVKEILEQENIFVMDEYRAAHQDIRPLSIGLLNLMPLKEDTELQILRSLSNTPIQVDVTFVRMTSHVSKNTSTSHIYKFYEPFESIRDKRFDGFIITGAPVEQMPFEEVDYWDEMKEIMEWTKTNVTSTIFICWGAMAALYHFYGIRKYPLSHKLFGVFAHRKEFFETPDPLMRGISDEFHMCHSRHSTVRESDVRKDPQLKVLATSHRAGVSVISNLDHSQVFVLGHMEYDRDTLKKEYERDLAKGLDIRRPFCYFADQSNDKINMNWSSTSNLFYNNWLNFVYQTTPYQFDK